MLLDMHCPLCNGEKEFCTTKIPASEETNADTEGPKESREDSQQENKENNKSEEYAEKKEKKAGGRHWAMSSLLSCVCFGQLSSNKRRFAPRNKEERSKQTNKKEKASLLLGNECPLREGDQKFSTIKGPVLETTEADIAMLGAGSMLAPHRGRCVSEDTLLAIAAADSMRQPHVRGERLVSEETQILIAQAITEEARKRCFVCGLPTDSPQYLDAQWECPHIACASLECLQTLHSRWLDIRHELLQMEEELP